MHITTRGDVTTIRYVAREQKEKARFFGFLLIALPGIFLIILGKFILLPTPVYIYIILYYMAVVVGMLLFGTYERKIEIHPERIYVKNHILEPELEYPIDKRKMVLILENLPFVQVIIPREEWRISLGYEDCVYYFASDLNDYRQIRQIAALLAEKLNLPVVDYTYQDQLEVIMFYTPGTFEMPFEERAVKFREMLMVGELVEEQAIFEDIISTTKRIYKWTPFTKYNIIASILVGGSCFFLVFLGVVGAGDSLFSIPFLNDNQILYNIIILGFLGALAFFSSIRKELTLELEKFHYVRTFFNSKTKDEIIHTHEIQEVRLKPSPRGFVLMIIGKNEMMELRTHLGGIIDFANLLWLTRKIQDYLLEIRGVTLEPDRKKEEERKSEDKEADGDTE